ncbi:hypothetical protein VNO80_25931 [Phaseolus coccineus]|uniref:Uncharacterized protein n=1 Tax=Phaseolus coccineus TaxID=3886 RepID=A0AAN9LVJ4_PHACN
MGEFFDSLVGVVIAVSWLAHSELRVECWRDLCEGIGFITLRQEGTAGGMKVMGQFFDSLVGVVIAVSWLAYSELRVECWRDLCEGIGVITLRQEGTATFCKMVGTRYHLCNVMQKSHIVKNVKEKNLYKVPDEVVSSPSLVTRACNPSGGMKVMGEFFDSLVGVVIAVSWLAHSELRVECWRDLCEGIGFITLRQEGTAGGMKVMGQFFDSLVGVVIAVSWLAYSELRVECWRDLCEGIGVITLRKEGIATFCKMVGTRYHLCNVMQKSHIVKNVKEKNLYKVPDEVVSSPSLVTRACNPSGGMKVMGEFFDSLVGVVIAVSWLAHSELRVECWRDFCEGIGVITLKQEGTA